MQHSRIPRRRPTARVAACAAVLCASPTFSAAQPDAATPTNQPAPQLDAAPATPTPRVRVSAYWENDGAVVLKPWHDTDRHYTNGTGAAVTWTSPKTQRALDAFLPPSDAAAFGLGFGHEIYTPANLLLDPPDPNDRPYAGYLYGSAFVQRQVNTQNPSNLAHLDALRLDLGIVGPSAQAKGIQTAIHDTFTGDDPAGWDSQLGDELTVQLGYKRKARLDLPHLQLGQTPIGQQLIPAAELNLGTAHRNAGASLTYRIGYRLPDDFGIDKLRDVAALTGQPHAPQPHPLGQDFHDTHGQWSLYAFGKVGGRYVQWNTFVEGSYAKDPSPGVSRQPWIGEAEAGIALGYQRGPNLFELNYATIWRTDEFQRQTGRDSFAALSLSWTFKF